MSGQESVVTAIAPTGIGRGRRALGLNHDAYWFYHLDSLGYYAVPDRADLYRREIMQTLTHAERWRAYRRWFKVLYGTRWARMLN